MKSLAYAKWKKAENGVETSTVSKWKSGMPYIYRHSTFPMTRKPSFFLKIERCAEVFGIPYWPVPERCAR
jgi:hypothetical protein